MITLRNVDAIKELKEIKDCSIDLIVTDPPYRITPRGSKGSTGGMFGVETYKNGKLFTHNDVEVTDYASEFFRILKDKTHCYVMCNQKNLQSFINEFTRVGFKLSRVLIWDKQNKIVGTYYMGQIEFILFLRKGGGKIVNDCGISELISIRNKKTKRPDGTNFHDTEKPVALMQLLIEQSTKEQELVLDPFVGIGATAIACMKTNRQFVGFELDEKYYAIAEARIKRFFNKQKEIL